jgi:transcriptional regulator with PAS, ATPase and Fis domain
MNWPIDSTCDDPMVENFLWSIGNCSQIGMVIVDRNGRILFVNKGYQQIYPQRFDSLIGLHFSEVNPHSKLKEILRDAKPILDVAAKSGGSVVVQYSVPLVHDRHPELDGAVEIICPINTDDVTEAVLNKLQRWVLEKNAVVPQGLKPNGAVNSNIECQPIYDNILGESHLIREVKETAIKAAFSDAAVLITGESGTGKELFANLIHYTSPRKNRPFVRVNCSSVPLELIESELFGYESGAFTGADKNGRAGKFELADKGTIFLDEIGDMPLSMQSKLLRALQEKEIVRVGGNTPKKIDFRLISATNRNLTKMVLDQSFRIDLFYRINALSITLPSLRSIKSDIPIMVNHFLDQLNCSAKWGQKYLSGRALKVLMEYNWPGNVRELKNTIERGFVTSRTNEIEVGDLHLEFTGNNQLARLNSDGLLSLREAVSQAEKSAIVEALKRTHNDKTAAAKILGIHRTGLHQKIKRLRINGISLL